jgi:Domain of unknown function (DUF3846)
MAILIRTDGWMTRLTPDNGCCFTLDELQHLVGGYIEVAHARGRRRLLVLNEDGRRLLLKPNPLATTLHHAAGGSSGDLVGDVVLCTWRELGSRDEQSLPYAMALADERDWRRR